MKFCPMCGSSQAQAGMTVCRWCDYEDKPIHQLSKQEIDDLMAPYEYEWIEDGARIIAVKSHRSISLRGAVGIPHFVTEIEADAFSYCKFLARIDLPRRLRSIGDGAFAQCRDLFDVFIPESVTHLGEDAIDADYIRRVKFEDSSGWVGSNGEDDLEKYFSRPWFAKMYLRHHYYVSFDKKQ